MWLPLAMGMIHLAYRNTNASLVGEQPLPAQVTNGTTKAARKARVARAQCKQQLDAWRADPSNCNLHPFYFCNLHISFDVPRLEAVLNRAAELTGCAGRDNVDADAGREGEKERRKEGFSEKTKMREQAGGRAGREEGRTEGRSGGGMGERRDGGGRVEGRRQRAREGVREGERSPPSKSSVTPPCSLYHNYRPATSGGWPRPGARWCPAMDTGQEVSPWNSSTGICHNLAWPPNPVSSDVQIQLNSLVYVHHGCNAFASG